MMRRVLLLAACLVVVVVVLAPAALIGAALFTTSGVQFLVRHLPEKLGPVRLRIVGVTGTVARGLRVERVEIDHELVHLRFEGIDGRVALAPLLLQTIRSPDATVHSALIEVKRRTRPSEPGELNFLPRWLLITAEHTVVDDLVVTVPEDFRLHATHITAAGVLRHRSIRFFTAQGDIDGAHVEASGRLRAAEPLGMEFHGHLDWHRPGEPAWTVEGAVQGDLNALNIEAHALSPFRAEVFGQGLDLTEHWHWIGDAIVHSFDLRAFGAGGAGDALGVVSGRLALTADAAGFTARGRLDPAGLHSGAFETQLAGSYSARVLTAKRLEVRHPASGARALAAGTIALAPGGPRLDLKGSWENFRWPLSAKDAAVVSAAGRFTLAGVLPYRVHLEGGGSVNGLALAPFDASGRLGRDGLTVEQAGLGLLGGQASLQAEVAWAPRQTWSIAGRFTGINPARLRADLPGSVSFTLAASGHGFDARGDLSATLGAMSGRLRGVRASGGGTLARSGGSWTFDKVRLGLGAARLALDGRAGERLDLRFALDTADLALLAPGSRGELHATGTVHGPPTDPAVSAEVHAHALRYQGLALESLAAGIAIDPTAPQRESKIEVKLRNLSFEHRTVQQLSLEVSGPPAATQAQLDARAGALTASARASGAYTHGLFQGELTALTFKGKDALDLALEHPVELDASIGRLRVDWLCLAGTPGAVCADADWSPAHWAATVMSRQLPLSALTTGMTPDVQYQGTIDALLHAAGGAAVPVTGTLRAELADAVLSHRLVSKKIEHTRIGAGSVTVTATPELVSAAALLGDGDIGTIRAQLEARRGSVAVQDMPLSGTLQAQTRDVALLSIYFPDIDRAAGELTADVTIAGTLGAPEFKGVAKLTGGELDLYQVNLGLREVGFEAHLNDSGLDFSGSARAGAGTATASGHLEWRALLPYGKIHLQGASLRVADIPEAQIDASPDLDFDIQGRRIEVTGKVAVPYAKIQPKDIANAVRTSPDEVIVGSEPPGPAERFEVMSNITLTLGDRVAVDASGLTGRLTGSVTVRSGYDAITRGTGELSVVDGKYLAYARKLDIQHGRLIFTGGAIDDPGVDLRAVKQFPEVTAGINVRGTLLAPRMSFFSDPPLPQSQIVSLILAGGSYESAQGAHPANAASSAALGQGAALLAAELGSRVGVPDVSLETDPLANETSLVLGRYLSPRLYVSYGVSLTEQLNTLKLRYTLGDHWTVKTELGTARGADLVVSIEK
ncbi:MAG TPA: translocation/assembly module TamB domain-containing protein [Steroidobacteraceae bacterium]|nr:translocation/assembly module TamB domain-containing protein [Steroidobacteraceae bacterium]